jgi:hypothetical protein
MFFRKYVNLDGILSTSTGTNAAQSLCGFLEGNVSKISKEI